MRRFTKSFVALFLALSLIFSAYLPSFAAGQPTKYSSTYNSGQRDVVCTTLSGTTVSGYYTGSYAYDSLDDLSSSALLTTLRTLMVSTHKYTSTYSDCRNLASKTDCENENGKVTLLYTSLNTTSSDWNREHVWPKSLGGYETSGPGADLHHIRPTDNLVNSNRGNLKYGNVTGGKTSTGGNAASGIVGGYYNNTYFEPLDDTKGDVARICLYMYVRYGGSYSKCSSITNVFQSVDVLLEWCAEDPVDTWEMGRNEVIYAKQGNRNVFIDYPELAWLLFGKAIPTTMTTPSGNASNGTSQGGNQGGNQGGDVDPTPTPTPTPTPCTHTNTTVKNAISATCGAEGYTGDTYCNSCGEKVKGGFKIEATGEHNYGEWIYDYSAGVKTHACSICGEKESAPISMDSFTAEELIVCVDSDAEKILLYLILGSADSLFYGEVVE